MPEREVQVVVISRKAKCLGQDDTDMTSFPRRPTPAELHPKILDPWWPNEARLGPALAMPRPSYYSIPYFPYSGNGGYI